MRIPRLLLALAAIVAIAVPATGAAAATPVPSRHRPVVVVFGDSLVDEASDYLRFFGGLRGIEVRVESMGGTALCDWLEEATRAVADPDVAAVALGFTGNNLTPCAWLLEGESLAARYAADVTSVMAAARPGMPVLWVTGPASPWPNPNGDLVASRTIAAASAWPDTLVVDGAPTISPGGAWSRTQPCLPTEPCTGPVVDGVRTNLVRAPDGVHFCPVGPPSVGGRTLPCPTYASGARRYAVAILEPLLGAAAGALDP